MLQQVVVASAHPNDTKEAALLLLATGLELLGAVAPFEPEDGESIGRMVHSDPLQPHAASIERLKAQLADLWLAAYDLDASELNPQEIWALQRLLDDLVAGDPLVDPHAECEPDY